MVVCGGEHGQRRGRSLGGGCDSVGLASLAGPVGVRTRQSLCGDLRRGSWRCWVPPCASVPRTTVSRSLLAIAGNRAPWHQLGRQGRGQCPVLLRPRRPGQSPISV